MKKIAVLYHKKCSDGFGAAWSAWKKFGNKALYLGVNHGESLPKIIKGKIVYLLDFSYPTDKTRELIKGAKKVISIDHHISAEKSIKMAHEYSYALNHSGAALAWKYFHPTKKIPVLISYVEDVDLWKIKLPKTMELNLVLRIFPLDFKIWSKIARDWEIKKLRKQYLMEGASMLKYENDLVSRIVEDAEEVILSKQKALAVNAPLRLASQIGSVLVKSGSPIGIIWQRKKGKFLVSLRSRPSTDVSKIAVKYGGGGHRNAAAFRLAINIKFPWKVIKK
ncbi:hypothetical protein A2662_03975 [Candidatus Giovannonibacteria bacterium RIFCSPHIGHO2_01_FULL_45_33]|uniref:DHHA1 domain-containing protein n=1 Tax=Candidatus Giovannonibacteria bacterium RIFCSPLOWO2_01_FULL_45_34 TaxID=1798351 RepID=A0A1F5X063_9BACT|nr:MAG: hypothetical protein A2662_03975 [Candidatus Giovannonibacteria bacterium RIFCSPHIGHO2_01_FULL_45_33]OGF69325.1 MAG: hypothetical protein A3C73_01800 [Candidatus Giovannonibacteria bacterium RIFCSPHIGHO2_02_FULL_44_11]OGF81259.1 MAG: hypothetical protein A2930_02240 [Candidatus Giovannonibacteria bacterium RIFCSPLOWO2_01_FULL_45_34]